jgi:hypothetical protein
LISRRSFPAAIAWWEKNEQVDIPAHDAYHSEGHDSKDQDEYFERRELPGLEYKDNTKAHAPIISEEAIDKISHLSNIHGNNEDSEHIAAAQEKPAAFGEGGSTAIAGTSSQGQSEAINYPEQASRGLHPLLVGLPEIQDINGHEELRHIHVEERADDSVSEVVDHPEVEQYNDVHEQGHDASDTDLEEVSTLKDKDHEFQVYEPSEEEHISQSQSPIPNPSSREIENEDVVHIGSDNSTRGPEDQAHKTRDAQVPTPIAKSQPENSQENSWQLQQVPHQEPEAPAYQVPTERPVTPTQASSTFGLALNTSQHVIQEESYSIAESPATVLDADDLFKDDDEEEEHQCHVDEYDQSRFVSQENATQPLSQAYDSQRNEPNQGKTLDAMETQPFLASLVDTIRPDLSLLRRLANQNSYPALTPLGDGPLVSDYTQPSRGEDFTPGVIEPVPAFQSQGLDAGLHIRTHAVDALPSFESYAQSDDDSTPTTPSETASSPFVDEPRNEPSIRSSWQDNSAFQGSDPRDQQQQLKSLASPLQGEFDPYNTHTYLNYISPRTSQVNLGLERSPRDSFALPANSILHRPCQQRVPVSPRSTRHMHSNSQKGDRTTQPSPQHSLITSQSLLSSSRQHSVVFHDVQQTIQLQFQRRRCPLHRYQATASSRKQDHFSNLHLKLPPHPHQRGLYQISS